MNHTKTARTTFQAGLGVASVDLWWGPFRRAPEYDKLCENALNFCKFKQQKAQVVLSVRSELMRLHSGHIRPEGPLSGY